MSRRARLLVISASILGLVPAVTRADIYVSAPSPTIISRYSNAGVFIESQTLTGSPETVSHDPAGNVYLTDYNNSLAVFPDGSFAGYHTISTPGTSPQYFGTASDSSGNIYFSTNPAISTSSDIQIFRYNAQSSTTTLFAATHIVSNIITAHNTLAVDPVTQNVFLAEYAGDRVIEFNTAGTAIQTFSGSIHSPFDIAIDHLGDLYVSNDPLSGQKNLAKIVISSGVTTTLTTQQTLAEARGIAVDNSNYVYLLGYTVAGNSAGLYEFSPAGVSLGRTIVFRDYLPSFVTITPEPATLSLLLVAPAGLMYHRRKR